MAAIYRLHDGKTVPQELVEHCIKDAIAIHRPGNPMTGVEPDQIMCHFDEHVNVEVNDNKLVYHADDHDLTVHYNQDGSIASEQWDYHNGDHSVIACHMAPEFHG